MTAGGPATPAAPRLRRARLRLAVPALVLLAAGLAARLVLCEEATRTGYFNDHFDNVGMGVTAEEHGLLKVYSVPQEDNPVIVGRLYDPHARRYYEHRRRAPRVANYPPLGVAIFWLNVKLLRAVDPSMTVNTYTSRLVMALPVFAADVLLAIGVFLLARRLASPKAALVAAGVCWLFPPLVMDSAHWAQTDAWPLVPAVFAIHLMLKRRWLAAGALVALAVALKPHGVLLGPVAAFGAVVVPPAKGRVTWRRFARRAVLLLAAGAVTLAVVTAPWTLTDGLAWADQAYLGNVRMYPFTTLGAFNVWYLDALGPAAEKMPTNGDSRVAVLGVTKDTWGRVLVLAAMATLAAACWWRLRGRPALALTLFAGLWLWSTFMWPTRVHERYIVYAMPFVIVAALAQRPAWGGWVAVALLAVVGVAEMTHYRWVEARPNAHAQSVQGVRRDISTMPAGRRPTESRIRDLLDKEWKKLDARRRESRPAEWAVTVTSILAYAYACVVPFVVAARPSPGSAPGKHGPPRRRRR